MQLIWIRYEALGFFAWFDRVDNDGSYSLNHTELQVSTKKIDCSFVYRKCILKYLYACNLLVMCILSIYLALITNAECCTICCFLYSFSQVWFLFLWYVLSAYDTLNILHEFYFVTCSLANELLILPPETAVILTRPRDIPLMLDGNVCITMTWLKGIWC